MKSTRVVAKDILAMRKPWVKKLLHCAYGLPSYSPEDYEGCHESQTYTYKFETSPEDILLQVTFDRNIGAPGGHSWGMTDLSPIITVGTDEYQVRVKDKASLIRLLGKFTNPLSNKLFKFKTGDLVYIRNTIANGKGDLSRSLSGRITAVDALPLNGDPVWEINVQYDHEFTLRYIASQEFINLDYQAEEYINRPLVAGMMECFTSHKEVYDRATAILELEPLQRQKEFLSLAKNLFHEYYDICKNEGMFINRFTEEETIDTFAAELQHWYETP